ncbi:DNA primase [Oscillospiraceae bacterium]|nr:DNA primase [Oscillospiraceae bacterium]
MAQIPDNVIEEILAKADIESVVGKYVSFTKRTGQNLFGLCPFHSEKTPSFSVSLNKGIYHCFGCGKGGNSIGFIMEIEKLSYPEAVRFLGNQYGVEIPEVEGYDNSGSTKKQKERVTELLTEAARFFYSSLHSPAGKIALEYARKRNLSKETMTSFGLGYAPEGWDNLVRHLRSKGYTEDEMKVSGLFTVAKNGNLIDLFRGRLMFPIFDSFGKIIAFGGRSLGDEMPKYVNSPDSLVYKKQDHLYGLNFAKKSKSNQLIIVEGYMDTIAMHQAGINNAVASLGTAFTDSQLRLASRYADEVVFFFDSDKAGQNAALRAIRMMLRFLKKMSGLKIRIKIAKVPDGKDPDEYIKNNGKEAFAAVVANAMDVDDYLAARAYDDNCDSDGKLDTYKYQEDIILYGSWISDDLRREKMASGAALYLGANYKTVLNRMNEVMESSVKEQEAADRRNLIRDEKQIVKERQEEASQDDSSRDVSVPKQKDDIVFMPELKLFVMAVRLKELLATEVDREDVLRPNDFRGRNMQGIVTFFLKNFNSEFGISEPLLINELSKTVLNGMPAEEVYLRACEQIPDSGNPKVRRDEYLMALYDLRLKQMESLEKKIAAALETVSKEKREDLVLRHKKLTTLKEHIIAKRERL